MRQIASRPQNDLDWLAKTCGGEDLGNYVVPRGTCAGEQKRHPPEPFRRNQPSRDRSCILEKMADGCFVVEHALVQFDAIQSDCLFPTRQCFKNCVQLFIIPDASASAHDTEFEQHM